MKTFKLYLGGSGQVGTYDVTHNPKFEMVVEMMKQLRERLLSDRALRKPILQLFEAIYQDNSNFPEHLKPVTPITDQILNQVKIQTNRTCQPCDEDVIAFLTEAFPHLYLELRSFRESNGLWGETVSGQESADKEEVTINFCLIQRWLNAAKYVSAQNFMYSDSVLNL